LIEDHLHYTRQDSRRSRDTSQLISAFGGRRQLIVYRAFHSPDVTTYAKAGRAYPERACVGCSMVTDQVAHLAHLNARDTTFASGHGAPQAGIQGLKERMGWQHIARLTLRPRPDLAAGARSQIARSASAGASRSSCFREGVPTQTATPGRQL
jgi:predicted dithiol-disulfide oxidoreductase (DUF899 family)